MKCLRTFALWLAALAAWLADAAPAIAVVTRWNTNSNGTFNNAANWDNGAPDAGDMAVFARGGGTTYTVTFPGAFPIEPPAVYHSNLVLIDSNNVTFAQSPIIVRGPSTYAIGTQLLVADFFQAAVLTTTLGTLSTPFAAIGFAPTADGTLNVNGGTFLVTGPGSPDETLLIGNSGAGTLNVSGFGRMNLTNANGEMVVAKHNGSVGTLNIFGGGQVADFSTVIALEPGSLGSVTVDGTGSSWTNNDRLIVGRSGIGMLTVSGGGQVNDTHVSLGGANGGVGVANITGAGSRWSQAADLQVGASLGTSNGVPQFAFGTLNITNTGQVNTAGDASIAAPTSEATVSSGGVWNVAGLLSIESAAVLDIQAGGLVNSNSAFVGSFNDGTATVNGTGATWNITESLFVGRNGTGTIHVTGGGRLLTRLAFLGVRPAIFGMSSALIQVDGPGSAAIASEQIIVGYEDNAQLLVTGGGQVTAGTGHVGFTASGDGRIHVSGSGSKWTSTESLYVGVAGFGDLTVVNGGMVFVDDLLSIGPRGTVQGNSTLVSEFRNGGTVAPGVSPSLVQGDAIGSLQIDGNYTQTAAGTLEIQLDSATVFDKLNVSGQANLSGALDVSFSNNSFLPTVGTSFEILSASGGVFNTFATTSLPTLGAGLGWNVTYSNFAVLLSAIASPLGDYNQNGVVDAADYVLWRETLNQTGMNLPADGNGNNQVDPGDYNLWRSNFGRTAAAAATTNLAPGESSGASFAAVPEPASFALWTLGLPLLSLRSVPAFRPRRQSACGSMMASS